MKQQKVQTESFERTEEIIRRLEARYGTPTWHPRLDPLDELIACILSQHTSDVNSFRAFDRLKTAFPDWKLALEVPPVQIADQIRCGGLADSKAPRIQAVLRAINAQQGKITLDFLDNMSDAEANDYLISLPGVGPKTAAIVLCFSLGRPVLPVDTHVFRVSWRLGLIDKKIGEAKAHSALQVQLRDSLVYRFHVGMITHGRMVCKAPTPRCSECMLQDLCDYYRKQMLTPVVTPEREISEKTK